MLRKFVLVRFPVFHRTQVLYRVNETEALSGKLSSAAGIGAP
jgi:hypothetical protein